jgi:hypothetical protein
MDRDDRHHDAMNIPIDAEMAPAFYRSRCHRAPLYYSIDNWFCCVCGHRMDDLDHYYVLDFGVDEWSILLDIMAR